MTPLPRSASEWESIVPNETDREMAGWWREYISVGTAWLAAASRLHEQERCVERLAQWLATDGPMRRTMDGHESEARRILKWIVGRDPESGESEAAG